MIDEKRKKTVTKNFHRRVDEIRHQQRSSQISGAKTQTFFVFLNFITKGAVVANLRKGRL